MMLDATAGNRTLWNNKYPPHVLFMDKETKLRISPDIFADFRFCPFRDKVFDCVLFDPPHYVTAPPWALNPRGVTKGKLRGTFYGTFKSKTDMLSSIHKAQREFRRISKRLCLKWCDIAVSLWKILPFFKAWKHIQTTDGRKRKTKTVGTWWVTFIAV